MIKREVFQCEHCKKFTRKPRVFFNSREAHSHEALCFYNPENKTCMTCAHNTRESQYDGDRVYRLGCELGEIKYDSRFSFGCNIIKNCDKWKYIHDNPELMKESD